MAFDANDLSPHEHFVVERARLGEIADFSPLGSADGSKPGVRAGFLRKLILELEPEWRLRAPGVRIKGARIDGALDLTDCSGQRLPALSLEGCAIAEPISIARSHIARVTLTRCAMGRIDACGARIDGDFDLREAAPCGDAGAEALTIDARGARVTGALILSGAKLARGEIGADVLALNGASVGADVLLDAGFEAFGRVCLDDARIGGALICEGGTLLNRTEDAAGVALSARGAAIGAALRMGRQFKAEGEIACQGARINGDADFSHANLRNEFGAALTLSGARIGGRLRAGVKIAGQMRLDGAEIGHTLDLRGAEIAHPLTPRGEAFGVALDASTARIAGAARLGGANIKGEARFSGARVQGGFHCGGGRFINAGAVALNAGGAVIGGDLGFAITDGYAPHGQKTVIEGGAYFTNATIGGDLVWKALEVRGPSPESDKGGALCFAGARIGGALEAAALVTHQGARIDLSGARCAILRDDAKAGWGGDAAALVLEGFHYERIDTDERWRARLAWLKRAPASMQPFAQAARAYVRNGRQGDAQRLMLAGRDTMALHAAPGPISWALSSLFGLIAGYGLSPLRMARTLVLFLALGVLGVLAMNAQGGLVTAQGRACNGAVEPALYAVDVALPVIDLGQASRCAPGRTARADMPAGFAIGESDWRVFEGAAMWRWGQALYALIGAILAVLAALTFSGALRPRIRSPKP